MSHCHGGVMRYIWPVLLLSVPLFSTADFAVAKEHEDGCQNTTQLHSERAKHHLDRKEYHEARSLLERALRTDSSNPKLYALLGDAWLGLGDHDKALESYSQAIRHHTRQSAVYYLRGRLYTKRKQWARAIEDYTNAIHLDPDDPGSYYSRGNVYYYQRKYMKAREDYESAWKRGLENPTTLALAQLLSMCPLASVRDGRLAVKYAKKALEQKQDNEARCLAVLAAAYAEAGEWDDAIRQCERAIQSDQTQWRELWILCLELYRLHEAYHEGPSQASGEENASSLWVLSPARSNVGEIMAAIKADSSRKSVKPNPQLAYVHFCLGEFFRYSDTVDAILHYNRCIELDPKNPHGFVGRSTAYSLLGKSQEAMADAKAALALSPKELSARCAFVWSLASLGQSNKAILEIDKMREEISDQPVLHLLRGHCYVAQGHFHKAVVALTEAIQRNPKLTIAYAERAVALSALDQADEAGGDLEECGRPSPSLREITVSRIKALHKPKPETVK